MEARKAIGEGAHLAALPRGLPFDVPQTLRSPLFGSSGVFCLLHHHLHLLLHDDHPCRLLAGLPPLAGVPPHVVGLLRPPFPHPHRRAGGRGPATPSIAPRGLRFLFVRWKTKRGRGGDHRHTAACASPLRGESECGGLPPARGGGGGGEAAARRGRPSSAPPPTVRHGKAAAEADLYRGGGGKRGKGRRRRAATAWVSPPSWP